MPFTHDPSRRWRATPTTSSTFIRYVLGVDGGGTGTRVRLSDRGGRLLGQGQAGPSALGQGTAQAWQHILEALQQAAAQAGVDAKDLSQIAVGLGLSGVSVVAQAERFMAEQPGFALGVLDGDGFTTVLGAHGGQPGAVVAAGTGSVGEVLRADGSRACVGGWGWLVGDEGSGAWLGRKAMQHAQQAQDGRAPAGALARAVWAQAGQTREVLLAWCAAAGQHGFASLAPLVFEQAQQDVVADGFLADAVIELEKLADALDPQGGLPLALAGSLALRLAPRFSERVRARCVAPQGDSAMGALHLIRAVLDEVGA
jgi:glucosamine kinase